MAECYWSKERCPLFLGHHQRYTEERDRKNTSGLLLRVLDTLKGLSHEIDIENVHENFTDLGWFFNKVFCCMNAGIYCIDGSVLCALVWKCWGGEDIKKVLNKEVIY
jgi:hypothetical protein